MKAYLNDDDLGVIVVFALRYCISIMTMFPEKVINIAKEYIHEYPDNCILTMWQDCIMQKDTNKYGDPVLDKPKWIEWTETVKAEKERRKL